MAWRSPSSARYRTPGQAPATTRSWGTMLELARRRARWPRPGRGDGQSHHRLPARWPDPLTAGEARGREPRIDETWPEAKGRPLGLPSGDCLPVVE